MKRGTKTDRVKVSQEIQEPILNIPQFLDRAVYFKQIRPEQRAEISAWFLHHDLRQATIEQFETLLAKY